MIRTQVYLEESASKKLRSIAIQTGKKQSELIREAISKFISIAQNKDPIARMQKAKGIWKNRKDLPNFKKLRGEWDRK
jgi:metal-responsive CopG/Arc/MetJ family transcriptional regulator|tara:strand:- start:1024 stop:1257 length:234 start_codon:yes stop_codon:yes gene_type:complete